MPIPLIVAAVKLLSGVAGKGAAGHGAVGKAVAKGGNARAKVRRKKGAKIDLDIDVGETEDDK